MHEFKPSSACDLLQMIFLWGPLVLELDPFEIASFKLESDFRL